jgi:hypothetical protein
MLILIAVVMAASLVSFAIAFDSIFLHNAVQLPRSDLNDKLSDMVSGKIWNSIVTQLQQLS